MTVILETLTPPDSGRLTLSLHVAADIIITRMAARQQVEEWLVKQQFTTPLFSQAPQLVLRTEGIYWRVSLERINGQAMLVGVIDVHVETGALEVNLPEMKLIKGLPYNVTQDPIYNMGSLDFEAPSDLSLDPDKYLYDEVEI